MVGIGDDIKDVLQELTTPFRIIPLTGAEIVGEYLDYEMYFEQSTEFIRQYAYSGTFQYDTQVGAGDLITFDNKYFLMMNIKKTLFENDVVDYSNFFIECNVLGRVSRGAEVRDGITKEITVTWNTIQDNVHGTMVVNAPDDQNLGGVSVIYDKFTLFTQGYTDLQAGDRWYPDVTDLTEYYQILSVDKYRFTGMLTMKLIEDSRE